MKKTLTILSLLLSCSSLLGQSFTWTSPVTISTSSVDATDPRVAMDTSGNVVAVWIENNSILANTLPSGGSWGTATTLSTGTASSPIVRVDGAGNATALWIDSGIATTRTLPLNGSWGTANALSGSGASDPHLAVDSTGNAVATWTIGSTIQSATKLFSGSWQITPDTVSDSGIPSDSSHVAIGSNGTVGLIWHGVQSSIDTIFASTKPINGSWSVIQTVSEANISAANPKIAVDGSGNCLAIWYEFIVSDGYFSNVSLKSSDLPSNGIWQSPVMLTHNLGITDPTQLNSGVNIDPSGMGIAVWTISFDGAQYFLESAIRAPSGVWSGPADLDASYFSNSLSFEVDQSGNVILAHMTGDPSLIQVVAMTTDIDSFAANTWSSPYFISNPTSGFPYASGYSDSSMQNAVVISENWNGTNTNVQVTLGSSPVFLPPSNLVGVQNQNNFGIFTEYYNTLTWSASLDPDLAGYAIFRNGLLLATLDPSTLQYVDQNRNPAQSDTYSVAAFGSATEQSSLITVTVP